MPASARNPRWVPIVSPGKWNIPRENGTFPGGTGECSISVVLLLRKYQAGSARKVFEGQLVALCVTIGFPKKHTGECVISVCARVSECARAIIALVAGIQWESIGLCRDS